MGLLCKWVFISLLLLFIGVKAGAQTPDPPVFDYVSINPDNGNVTVHWKPSPSNWVTGYIIQEEREPGKSYPITTVNITSPPYSHTFSFPKVLTSTVNFNIVATGGVGKESLRTDPSHSTSFSTAVYDSCKSAIIIKWTPYIGWGNNLTGYNVFLIDENLVITKFGDVNSSTLEYIVPGIKQNTNYCFYVSAVRNDGVASFSNKVCISTDAPLPPTYMTGEYTRYSGTNQVDLHFNIDPATVSDAYRLYRTEAGADNYTLLAELQKTANGTIDYSDAISTNKIYNYKLTYVSKCKIEGVSSIPVNNIVLKGKTESMTNKLNWNSFEKWAQGTSEVQVYRSEGGTEQLLMSLSPVDTEYSDVINGQDQLSGDLCYQVKIISNPDANGNKFTSESNVFCVNMTGEIHVPNAFTPDNNGKNDRLKPTFVVLPSKYKFVVYNRYGAKIWETSNISEGWNGLLSDGTKALEGTYIYYIKIENGAGKVHEERGNFNLIYP